MTATQVVLRFIENEYMNADGSVNKRKFKLWRTQIITNPISSVRKRKVKSKTFVDDYLYDRSYTLNAFIKHFFHERTTNLYYDWLYGCSRKQIEMSLSYKWKKFLEKHIVESDDFKKRWIKTKNFKFTWKD